jgi:proton-dependent oligopeptide transporter, POT family
MVLSALSTDPLLVWNYGAMGCIAGIGGIVFWWSFRKLDAEEDKLNNLVTGHLDAKQ